MDEIVIWTDVYVPPEETFAFLVEFTNYAEYSEYLTEVRQHGDGGEGTEYELAAEWWRISYRARTRVTGISRPERIAWQAIDPIEAHGAWELEPIAEGTRVRLRIAFDAETADEGAVGIPAFVPVSWVVERVKPLVRREAEDVVERIVADLEGEPRDVDLTIDVDRGD